MCQFLCCILRGSYQVIDDGCVAVLYTVKPYMQQSVGKNSIQGSGWVYIVFLGYQYIHLPSEKSI